MMIVRLAEEADMRYEILWVGVGGQEGASWQGLLRMLGVMLDWH
jgi:hypothetical protein